MRERILHALYRSIETVNEQLPSDGRLPKAADFPVFGPRGHLDSLGFVSFVLAAEEELVKEFGTSLGLAERLVEFSQTELPESLGDLAGFVATLLETRTHVKN